MADRPAFDDLGALISERGESGGQRNVPDSSQCALLADLIMDQFGDFDGGLVGVDRQWAEHLSRRWLQKLKLDEHSTAR